VNTLKNKSDVLEHAVAVHAGKAKRLPLKACLPDAYAYVQEFRDKAIADIRKHKIVDIHMEEELIQQSYHELGFQHKHIWRMHNEDLGMYVCAVCGMLGTVTECQEASKQDESDYTEWEKKVLEEEYKIHEGAEEEL